MLLESELIKGLEDGIEDLNFIINKEKLKEDPNINEINRNQKRVELLNNFIEDIKNNKAFPNNLWVGSNL